MNKFEDGRAVLDNRAITTMQQCFLSDIIRTILTKSKTMAEQISSGIINSWSCFSHMFSEMRSILPRETIDLLENQGFHFTTMDIPLRVYTPTELELVRVFLSINHYYNFNIDESLFEGWKLPLEEDLFGKIVLKEVIKTESGKEVVLQDNTSQNDQVLGYLSKKGIGQDGKDMFANRGEEGNENGTSEADERHRLEAVSEGILNGERTESADERSNDTQEEEEGDNNNNNNNGEDEDGPNQAANVANPANEDNASPRDRPVVIILDDFQLQDEGIDQQAREEDSDEDINGPTPLPPLDPDSVLEQNPHIALSNPYTCLSMRLSCYQFFPDSTHKTSLFLSNVKGLLDLIDQVLIEAESTPRQPLPADVARNACKSHSTATASLNASKVPQLHATYDELAQVDQSLAEQLFQRSQAPPSRLRELDQYITSLYQRQNELRSKIVCDLLDCLIPLAIPAAAQLYNGCSTVGVALEPFQCLTDLFLSEEPLKFDELSTPLRPLLTRPHSPRPLPHLGRLPHSTFLRSRHPPSRLRSSHPPRQAARSPRGNPRVR